MEQVNFFRENGYLVIPDFAPVEQVLAPYVLISILL